jgi:hypothetical protein
VHGTVFNSIGRTLNQKCRHWTWILNRSIHFKSSQSVSFFLAFKCVFQCVSPPDLQSIQRSRTVNHTPPVQRPKSQRNGVSRLFVVCRLCPHLQVETFWRDFLRPDAQTSRLPTWRQFLASILLYYSYFASFFLFLVTLHKGHERRMCTGYRIVVNLRTKHLSLRTLGGGAGWGGGKLTHCGPVREKLVR